MPRPLRALLVLAAALLALVALPAVTGAAPAPTGPGNSPNAKACQKGGYTGLVRLDGTTFATEQACTSYAAQGGTLVPLAVARPCLNGGYATLLRSDSTPFATQADCVGYAAAGGTLVPKPATITVSFRLTAGGTQACDIDVQLTGFAPDTTYSVRNFANTVGISTNTVTTDQFGAATYSPIFLINRYGTNFEAVADNGVSSLLVPVRC